MAEQEMKAASETYSGFLSLLKVGSIITAIVTVFVVLIISSSSRFRGRTPRG
jgi:hypothetical protein